MIKNKNLKPLVQTGEFDKGILCAQCDNEILASLEKYAQKLLSDKNLITDETPHCTDIKAGNYEVSECTNFDYKRFKLFLLSILWRSHITTRPAFSSVKLGPHADEIRKMIWDSSPGDYLKYPIVITSFARADYQYKDTIFLPKKRKCESGINSYIFSIGSFLFHIYVNSAGHKLPVEYLINEFALKENKMRIVHLKNGLDIRTINYLLNR